MKLPEERAAEAQVGPETSPTPEEAWEQLTARWDDEAAHEVYLSRCSDLEGLAQAGRRYREMLQSRAGDPVALRWCEEIVKRATVLGLTQLPRTRPPRPMPRWARVALAAAALWVVAYLLWFLGSLLMRAFHAVREAAP